MTFEAYFFFDHFNPVTLGQAHIFSLFVLSFKIVYFLIDTRGRFTIKTECCNLNISAFPFRGEKKGLKILPLITFGED